MTHQRLGCSIFYIWVSTGAQAVYTLLIPDPTLSSLFCRQFNINGRRVRRVIIIVFRQYRRFCDVFKDFLSHFHCNDPLLSGVESVTHVPWAVGWLSCTPHVVCLMSSRTYMMQSRLVIIVLVVHRRPGPFPLVDPYLTAINSTAF